MALLHLPTESWIRFGWHCSRSAFAHIIFYLLEYWRRPSPMQILNSAKFIFTLFWCRRWRRRFGIFSSSILYILLFLYISRCLGFIRRRLSPRHCRGCNRTRTRIIFRIINLTAPVVNLINGTEPALQTMKSANEKREKNRKRTESFNKNRKRWDAKEEKQQKEKKERRIDAHGRRKKKWWKFISFSVATVFTI